MKFTSSSDATTTFELAILGYTNMANTWRDRNQLQCQVSTFFEKKADTYSTPLQTWEIRRLLSELQLLWRNVSSSVALTFSEPGLSLAAKVLSNNVYCLQIQLGHSLTPSWHKYPDFPVEMAIFLNRDQLQEAIRELSDEVDTYPER